MIFYFLISSLQTLVFLLFLCVNDYLSALLDPQVRPHVFKVLAVVSANTIIPSSRHFSLCPRVNMRGLFLHSLRFLSPQATLTQLIRI